MQSDYFCPFAQMFWIRDLNVSFVTLCLSLIYTIEGGGKGGGRNARLYLKQVLKHKTCEFIYHRKKTRKRKIEKKKKVFLIFFVKV